MVSFPKVLQEVICTVPGCPAVAHIAGRLHKHFMFHHFRSKVLVFQEGKDPLPCCDLCRIHMSVVRLIHYRKTARYDRNTQMRWRQLYVAIAAKCLEATFNLKVEDES